MTKRLKDARAVSLAKAFFYKKYATDYKNGRTNFKGASVTNFGGVFGFTGLVAAGFDIVEQFVGTMDINIYVDEKGANFLIDVENTTSAQSAFYRMSPSWDRDPNSTTPMGNMSQLFIWKEPIEKVHFLEVSGDVEYNPIKYNNTIDW